VQATQEPSTQKQHISTSNGETHVHHPRRRFRLHGYWLRTAFSLLILGLLAFVIFSPARFAFPVHTYATITPAQKWILVKGTSGQLVARTFNYQSGMSDGYRVANFATGTSITFTIAPSLGLGQHVSVGDTVGWISSSETQERLVVLNGQLAAAEQMLAVNASGQKSAVITEAEQRLRAAQRQRDEYQPTLDRYKTLFDRNLIAAGEYENVQSNSHRMDDDIAIATAGLEAARTGAKPEQVALAESNVAALKNEISAINSRAATFTLRTPINGVVVPTASGDTLLTIASTSACVAMVPIRWIDYPRVSAMKEPRITIAGYPTTVGGKVIAINREMQNFYGQPVVMATAILDSQPGDLLPGSLVRCNVAAAPLTPFEYSKVLFRSALNGGSN
jgi:hypothetical protein